MKATRLLTLPVALALLAPTGARAHEYQLKPIVKLFEPTGLIPPDLKFFIGGLNDAGQIAFFAGSPTNPKSEVLLQYSDGKVSRIAAAGTNFPGGTWPRGTRFDAPVSMNRFGCIVFSSLVRAGDVTSMGTVLWDYPRRQLVNVALTGMQATDTLAFTAGGASASAINNFNEIALVARVPNAAKASRGGLFFRTTTGRLLPVALPDADLPGGGKIDQVSLASINDAGSVAFLVRRVGETTDSAYLSPDARHPEGGKIVPVAVPNADAPGGRKFARALGIWVNNQNGSALVAARLDDATTGPDALYRFADGQFKAVLLAGQDLPDGNKLKSIDSVSAAGENSYHALLVQLESGARAAYMLEPNGTIEPILRVGQTVEAGTITHLGPAADSFGIAVNGQGQVALGARIGGGVPTLFLLTPEEE